MNSSRIWALVLLASVSIAACSAEEDVEVTGLWGVFCDPQEGVMGFESSQIGEFAMVLYQEGSSLFGACTGESPEPWNGLVMGEIVDDQIHLEVSILNPILTMAGLNGEFLEGGSIEGNFVCSDEEGNGWHGTFMGWLTNPDPSLYEPALVKQVSTEVSLIVPVAVALVESQVNLSVSQAMSQDAEKLQELEALVAEPSQEKAKTVYRIDYTHDTIYPRPVM